MIQIAFKVSEIKWLRTSSRKSHKLFISGFQKNNPGKATSLLQLITAASRPRQTLNVKSPIAKQ